MSAGPRTAPQLHSHQRSRAIPPRFADGRRRTCKTPTLKAWRNAHIASEVEEFHGRLYYRLAESRDSLVSRDRRNRMDRRIVLFRRTGQQPETADGPEPAPPRCVRRTVARARRRLLQHAEVHRRTA